MKEFTVNYPAFDKDELQDASDLEGLTSIETQNRIRDGLALFWKHQNVQKVINQYHNPPIYVLDSVH